MASEGLWAPAETPDVLPHFSSVRQIPQKRRHSRATGREGSVPCVREVDTRCATIIKLQEDDVKLLFVHVFHKYFPEDSLPRRVEQLGDILKPGGFSAAHTLATHEGPAGIVYTFA